MWCEPAACIGPPNAILACREDEIQLISFNHIKYF
ncbi:Uncharacterised protein [Bordetella pertussis]|nr:Uncharacterised protein [Bordetella pertussis]